MVTTGVVPQGSRTTFPGFPLSVDWSTCLKIDRPRCFVVFFCWWVLFFLLFLLCFCSRRISIFSKCCPKSTCSRAPYKSARWKYSPAIDIFPILSLRSFTAFFWWRVFFILSSLGSAFVPSTVLQSCILEEPVCGHVS